jgi:hypothetical protein
MGSRRIGRSAINPTTEVMGCRGDRPPDEWIDGSHLPVRRTVSILAHDFSRGPTVTLPYTLFPNSLHPYDKTPAAISRGRRRSFCRKFAVRICELPVPCYRLPAPGAVR